MVRMSIWLAIMGLIAIIGYAFMPFEQEWARCLANILLVMVSGIVFMLVTSHKHNPYVLGVVFLSTVIGLFGSLLVMRIMTVSGLWYSIAYVALIFFLSWVLYKRSVPSLIKKIWGTDGLADTINTYAPWYTVSCLIQQLVMVLGSIMLSTLV